MVLVSHETTSDYLTAVESIKSRGYDVRGIIIDGMPSLFRAFSGYHVQMRQFHMRQIMRRSLTLHPKMHACKELQSLVEIMTKSAEDEFVRLYDVWKTKWKDTANLKTVSKGTGRSHYTHKRLRSAIHSLDTYLPYLFTYQKEELRGMPNTNNKIEGTFTNLKKHLNNHSGMTKENRKRFISGFFLKMVGETSLDDEAAARPS